MNEERVWVGVSLSQKIQVQTSLDKDQVNRLLRALESLGVLSKTRLERGDFGITHYRWTLHRPDARVVKRDGLFCLED